MKGRESSRKKSSGRKDTITSIIFLVLVVIGILIVIFYNGGLLNGLSPGDRKINANTGKAVKGKVELNPDIMENPDISYPGYEKLILKSNKKRQNVYLYNPRDNTCYFQMRIILEDSNVIWQSDYLEPGQAFDRIELDGVLEKGTYENAVLQYDSYSIKDGRKLNGSSIKLTLEVQ